MCASYVKPDLNTQTEKQPKSHLWDKLKFEYWLDIWWQGIIFRYNNDIVVYILKSHSIYYFFYIILYIVCYKKSPYMLNI